MPKAVGVLVAAVLPGRMRIAEPDVDLQAAGQFRVAGHFRPTIISHAFAERCRQPLHLPGEAADIVSGDIVSGERRKLEHV